MWTQLITCINCVFETSIIWSIPRPRRKKAEPRVHTMSPLLGNIHGSRLSPPWLHLCLFTETQPNNKARSQVGRIKGIVRDTAAVWWEVTTLKQHFTSTHYILHNSEDLRDVMRATRSAVFMGRFVKAMSNTAISIDSNRQRCLAGLMAKANVMLH